MAAQICETCKKKGNRCACAPNSTCGAYEPRKMTRFEKIKLMNIEEMAGFFSARKYPNLPHSPCYICQYDQGLSCIKSYECADEYKTWLYKQWLEEEVEE